MEFSHVPVLLDEVIEQLRIRPGGVYVDGTVGGGGHAYEICRRLDGPGRLICLDRDEEAIAAAKERLAPFARRVTLIHDNFRNMARDLRDLDIAFVDGILLDLGLSSHQIDDPERGFSYRWDAALDMRMDRRQELTARQIVNEWPEDELCGILREYGEEPYARNIAARIVKAREKKDIETTGELNEIILSAVPAKFRARSGHPSKRVFQALRIACNGELDALRDILGGMTQLLAQGGRMCVITFHSLEDRIVKDEFRRQEHPCTCPPDFPVCVCGKKPTGRVVTRKPIMPSQSEIEANSRAKSAKLRVFEKTSGEVPVPGDS